jgi:hypothetical protein
MHLVTTVVYRVSMAGGFLKSWKRKHFRLRDHSLVCFKHHDDATPLFEIHFRVQSIVVIDKANTNHNGAHEDASTMADTEISDDQVVRNEIRQRCPLAPTLSCWL